MYLKDMYKTLKEIELIQKIENFRKSMNCFHLGSLILVQNIMFSFSFWRMLVKY